MKRELREDKLLETVRKIQNQIATRFPSSGLSIVAADVVQVTQEAMARAHTIRSPNRWMQACLVLLGLIAVGGVVAYVQSRTDETTLWQRTWHFLDEAKGSAAILTAATIFVVTSETRMKRKRALKAVHELRAIAHIIDMHQLVKDPDRLGDPINPPAIAGKPMDADLLGRYLHFCTELLAITSKIGQLYVQDFPDPRSLAAVDQFELLATGLSSKIWQKLIILDHIRSDENWAHAAAGT